MNEKSSTNSSKRLSTGPLKENEAPIKVDDKNKLSGGGGTAPNDSVSSHSSGTPLASVNTSIGGGDDLTSGRSSTDIPKTEEMSGDTKVIPGPDADTKPSTPTGDVKPSKQKNLGAFMRMGKKKNKKESPPTSPPLSVASIITQVERPPSNPPRSDGKLRSLLCCGACHWQRYRRRQFTPDNHPTSPSAAGSMGNQMQMNGALRCDNLLGDLADEFKSKKCFIIDLDETLVHSSFKAIDNADFKVGVDIEGTIHQVYVLKRPYVDQFLKRMAELYECVLFTASLAKYADPVADFLDKWTVFRHRLFREACVYHRGNYVKDLGRLGRTVDQVVILDNSPASYLFHTPNAVQVSSWFDDPHDVALRDLIPFFERLAVAPNVPDFLTANPLPPSVTGLTPPVPTGILSSRQYPLSTGPRLSQGAGVNSQPRPQSCTSYGAQSSYTVHISSFSRLSNPTPSPSSPNSIVSTTTKSPASSFPITSSPLPTPSLIKPNPTGASQSFNKKANEFTSISHSVATSRQEQKLPSGSSS